MERTFNIPENFSVGFGRAPMNPPVNVFMALGGRSTGNRDCLMATCVAVCDGDDVVLLFHMDMKETPRSIFDPCADLIEKELGIPRKNMIMTSTHTHASPHTTVDIEENKIWRETLKAAVLAAAKEAVADFAPAKLFISKGDTTGFAFVRRFLLADGTYKMNPRKMHNPIAYESIADPELRVLHVKREGKDDVVMVSWQSHYGCGDMEVTADFVHHLRTKMESEMPVKVAYFNGGSANIITNNLLGDRFRKLPDYIAVGEGLAKTAMEAMKSEEEIESGKIFVQQMDLMGKVKQDPPERQAHAAEILSVGEPQRTELIEKYGFESIHQVYPTYSRSKMGKEYIIPISAISFGDFAISAAPFELFDMSCRDIRECSPYKMTFACAYSNEHLGYMPPARIFPHGGYEVFKAFFVQGTADQVVNETVRMLCENYIESKKQ
ncbi:MAG: hypothetical protein IKU24_02440 [Clostridia bacterium]|nr:hypothetical protein [Clostridia bacterium]